MVSSDVHKEVQTFKMYLDEEEDVQSAELQDDLRRETTQLRKIGLGVLEMGKKKLKGLEGKPAARQNTFQNKILKFSP